ncbi:MULTISPECIES: fluoride efflux transporter CrcB [Xanthomonas]|uniref:Fluoride-specific ion channel FluC n=3 Tax=Xanthomonas TaxID=338 RepID=A0A2S6ZXW7_9XANT|nr:MULTISPECIES: fluoride efflux transporter CrcB [Xanthomonas]ATS38969.1 fluoride efflux transporter CrcB [Xanthomonas citri pv. phaseoli var. fuscans]ATS42228.1 fluoride efflux transporter CrcB [Xanthomonas citri pv. phaseoli var. fuscans]ATS46973.1 fluoride efflux transporter CrcB [Xanthomonas citri pv. phaseoli var. fuscans]ATS82769.1 fluoride efflux transporter CrcB [Xanthomonas citri pv. phaseoli var. fuscans]PPT97829.1 camphor resistance protein CrcB [Xanthomonas arboricola pv. guizotia
MNAPVWWQQLLLAMTGGALGSGLRFAIGASLIQRFGTVFPWGTLTVNLLGSFVAGVLLVWLDARGPSSWPLRALLIVGVIGGLTTFSSLMMECLVFARTDRSTMIGIYLAVTLLAGLALVFAGARIGQWLVTR